jgi:hypothetical protein
MHYDPDSGPTPADLDADAASASLDLTAEFAESNHQVRRFVASVIA